MAVFLVVVTKDARCQEALPLTFTVIEPRVGQCTGFAEPNGPCRALLLQCEIGEADQEIRFCSWEIKSPGHLTGFAQDKSRVIDVCFAAQGRGVDAQEAVQLFPLRSPKVSSYGGTGISRMGMERCFHICQQFLTKTFSILVDALPGSSEDARLTGFRSRLIAESLAHELNRVEVQNGASGQEVLELDGAPAPGVLEEAPWLPNTLGNAPNTGATKVGLERFLNSASLLSSNSLREFILCVPHITVV